MRMRAIHTAPRRPPAIPWLVILAIALIAAGDSRASETQEGLGLPVEVSEVTVKPKVSPVPGARVVLNVEDLVAAGVRYRWVQSEGPPVAIEDATRRSIEVTIPGGAPRLGFLLVATGHDRVRIVRVAIPIQTPEPGVFADAGGGQSAALVPQEGSEVRADAGDDQLGVIGHRVTLNGSGSRPVQGLACRWVQLSGPPIVAAQQERAYYSFVPSALGLYRFALVVAAGGVISAPDEVTVLVGDASSGSGPTAVPSLDPRPSGPATLATTPAPAPLPTAEQVLGMALPRLSDGRQVAAQVADVFESVAGRVDLYTSFAELQDEVRRRLDVVIPAEPLQRQAWVQTVFQPLTLTTASQLAASGVDLQSPASLGQALTPEQRQGLRSHFVMLARAFRALSATERSER